MELYWIGQLVINQPPPVAILTFDPISVTAARNEVIV